MKWAFIDYENIGTLNKVKLSEYEKIILFLGSKQQKIDFGDKKYSSPTEITVIQVKVSQANNLDFHLSFYLGMYNEKALPGVSFEIISNDNGFSPLISHIKLNGRSCKQIKINSSENSKNILINSLISRAVEKRPQKVSSLKNHIAANLKLQGNEVAI